MKQTTRDNLIYLGVAFSIVALLVFDLIHAEQYGRPMWMPSNFAFRTVASTGLLAYCLGKMMRKDHATRIQIVAGILFACAVNIGIMFMFRQAVEYLAGLSYGALAVVELFFLGILSGKVSQLVFPKSKDG